MRTFIKFAVLALVMFACGSGATDFSKLQERNGLFYMINAEQPFTGKVVNKINDALVFEGEFKDGLRVGQWRSFYSNGQLKTEGSYVDGLEDGTWTFYHENGIVDYNQVYRLGNLVGGEERPKEEEKKEAPKKVAPQVQYVEWDQLRGGRTKTLYGKLYTGGFIQRFNDGTKKLVGYYTNGHRSGKWTYYYPNGSVKEVRNY